MWRRFERATSLRSCSASLMSSRLIDVSPWSSAAAEGTWTSWLSQLRKPSPGSEASEGWWRIWRTWASGRNSTSIFYCRCLGGPMDVYSRVVDWLAKLGEDVSSSSTTRWISDWFKKADKNNDGRMNFKEVRDLLKMMNVDMSEHHAHRLFTVRPSPPSRGHSLDTVQRVVHSNSALSLSHRWLINPSQAHWRMMSLCSSTRC